MISEEDSKEISIAFADYIHNGLTNIECLSYSIAYHYDNFIRNIYKGGRIKLTDEVLFANGYELCGFNQYINIDTNKQIVQRNTKNGKFFFQDFDTNRHIKFLDELLTDK